ncbi:MAG: hypothetical protein ACOC2J_02990, partial [bacterium]
ITMEEYRSHQKEMFEEYQLRISDISVSQEIEKIDLPREFRKIITELEGKEIYKIMISYKMDFKHSGSEETREEENPVYMLRKNRNYYLLWDPYIIKDEQKEDEEEVQ